LNIKFYLNSYSDNIIPTKRCASNKPIKNFNTTNLTSEDPNKQINILCDIGHYINRSLKQHEIEEILEKILKPELNYKFLVTEKNKNFNIYSYIVLIGSI